MFHNRQDAARLRTRTSSTDSMKSPTKRKSAADRQQPQLLPRDDDTRSMGTHSTFRSDDDVTVHSFELASQNDERGNVMRINRGPFRTEPPIVENDATPKTSHRKTISSPEEATSYHSAVAQPLPPVQENLPRNENTGTEAVVFQDLLGDAPDVDCHICSNSLCRHKAVALVACGHIYHQSCLEISLQYDHSCPICHGQVYGDDESSKLNPFSHAQPITPSKSESSVMMMTEEREEESSMERVSWSPAQRSPNQRTLASPPPGVEHNPPPLLIPSPSYEQRGSITEMRSSSQSFYDVATAASALLFSTTPRPSDERRNRLDNVAAGGLSVNSIRTVDDVVYKDFQKAVLEGELDRAYVHGWRYCYFCLAYSITGQHLGTVVHQLEDVVHQMDEQDRQLQHLIRSPADRAQMFVSSALELYDRLRECVPIVQLIQPLRVDDVRCMAEEMFRKQEQLRAAATSANTNPTILAVDIGYLYTRESNLDRVRTGGLLTNTSDRHSRSILHNYIGSTYGNGVYTSSNPYAYHDPRFGQVGVLVARLKGVEEECYMDQGMDDIVDASCDSVNVVGDDSRVNITVLRQSCQCLPLACFPNSVIEPGNSWAWGNYALTEIHTELQKVIDEFFNNAQVTSVRIEEPFVPTSVMPGMRTGQVRRKTTPEQSETIIYNAPSFLSEEEQSCLFQKLVIDKETPDCCICRSTLNGSAKAVVLRECKHPFHLKCINRAVQHSRKCPLCRVDIEEPRGEMPSGRMAIKYDENSTCAGFSQGCIVIRYSLPRCNQRGYHKNPGRPVHGADRTAFLPDNSIGNSLLVRLKYAFQHGLTFSIADSSTTRDSSVLAWTILHKTRLGGQGSGSFPDSTYFSRVNQELDILGVPSAAGLKASLARSRLHQQQRRLTRALPVPSDFSRTIEYQAPDTLPGSDAYKTVQQPVRKRLFRLITSGRGASSDASCGVCAESLANERAVVQLNDCEHQFHAACIENALCRSNVCPCCQIPVTKPHGTMPSGNMSISFDPGSIVAGDQGCIVIRYSIPSGEQKSYHPRPGNTHCSVDKTAHLPSNVSGRSLLMRLEYAFRHGLTFTVSDSSQLWWTIPHPDEYGNFLPNCNRALDRLGVPSVEVLRRATI